MKIDFSQKILDFKDEPVVDAGKDLTLSSACMTALNIVKKEDTSTGDQKFKKYELSMRIKDGGVVDISTEEIVLIKAIVGEIYVPLLVGRIFDLLEGKLTK